MPKINYPIFKRLHRGQGGFTLIELLIVIAILGVIGAVVALNVGGFFGTGNLEAANSEASTVRTAAFAYVADNGLASYDSTGSDPGPGTAGDLGAYLVGTNIKATYHIDTTTACGLDVTSEGDWDSTLNWDSDNCRWVKAP